MDALNRTADAAALHWRASVQRRYGHDAGAAYVTMPLDQLVQTLHRLELEHCTRPGVHA